MRRLVLLIFPILLLISCEDEPVVDPLEESVVTYFKEIALGFEFGGASQITRKWKGPVKVLVYGDNNSEMLTELNSIIDEINDLATDNLQITMAADSSDFNYFLFLGTGQEYGALYPAAQPHVASNWGLFFVNWNGLHELNFGTMYVDMARATDPNVRKHLLREEFTQSLGLARDSNRYPESIFQSAWTTTTTYAPIDRTLIQILYHPDLTIGLDALSVDPVIRGIYRNL